MSRAETHETEFMTMGVPRGLPETQAWHELATRGMNDGWAGRARASESQVYANAYERGQRFAMVESGELVIALHEASFCYACQGGFLGVVQGCGCNEPARAQIVRGVMALYGAHAMHSEPELMSYERIHGLMRRGVRVVAIDGEDLTGKMPTVQ